MPLRVLVCGGRTYADRARVTAVLRKVHRDRGIILLIEGGARGADRLAKEWAEMSHIPVKTYPADWGRWGRAAGHIRNTQMLTDGQPSLVLAFPGGRGTANMITQARRAGIPVHEVQP